MQRAHSVLVVSNELMEAPLEKHVMANTASWLLTGVDKFAEHGIELRHRKVRS